MFSPLALRKSILRFFQIHLSGAYPEIFSDNNTYCTWVTFGLTFYTALSPYVRSNASGFTVSLMVTTKEDRDIYVQVAHSSGFFVWIQYSTPMMSHFIGVLGSNNIFLLSDDVVDVVQNFTHFRKLLEWAHFYTYVSTLSHWLWLEEVHLRNLKHSSTTFG